MQTPARDRQHQFYQVVKHGGLQYVVSLEFDMDSDCWEASFLLRRRPAHTQMTGKGSRQLLRKILSAIDGLFREAVEWRQTLFPAGKMPENKLIFVGATEKRTRVFAGLLRKAGRDCSVVERISALDRIAFLRSGVKPEAEMIIQVR